MGVPSLNVGSLFSGIGGIDLGLERAGMRVLWQCEADPWRRAVLRRHWPATSCYEDVHQIDPTPWATRNGARRRALGGKPSGTTADPARDGLGGPGACDLLCGGFPCQDLSVAGRRAGLAGERSSLFFEFARVADAVRPRWLLVENVPGLLSSHGGRDFAVLLATLAELGYGVCWRVLDSRYFGVPQRRRRVFVVGHLGARGAAPFLPFLEGGEGDSAAGGEARTDAAYASLSGLGSGGPDDNDGQGGRLIANSLNRRDNVHNGQDDDGSKLVVAAPLSHGSNPNSNAAGRRREDDENLVVPISGDALRGEGVNKTAGADAEGRVRLRDPGLGVGSEGDPSYTLSATEPGAVGTSSAVRRLTPTECCRLQGFPDDWLGPPNEPPDSPRYAALGDAVTVPVAEWIGRRIMEAMAVA